MATAALDAEQEILFVPRSAWLTRKTRYAPFRAVIDDPALRERFSHSMSRLALLLALERATPGSFFAPYLASLGAPTVPYDLTPQERAALQGLPLEGWIDEQLALTGREWAKLSELLGARHPEVWAARGITTADWRWAYGHVMQRTFSVDLEGDEVWVIVPGMDLCNHADRPNARFFAEADGWHLEARRPIARGEQITIRYGRVKTSSDLLLYYGFVPPDNPNDRIECVLELDPDDPDHEEKTAAIGLLGLETRTLLGADGALPSRFLHAAILWGLPSAAFRADAPDLVSPGRATAALGCVATGLSAALAAWPTTLEEDIEALALAPTGGWLGAFLRYRANVKALVRSAHAAIAARGAQIRASGWRPSDFVPDDPDGRYGLATVRCRTKA